MFLERKGYAVDCAEDGQAGLEQANGKNYNLVISDVMMPNMNGLQFLGVFRKMQPETPVIMITGYTDLRTAVDAMKMGAVDFITKPFHYDQVEQLIHNLLQDEQMPTDGKNDTELLYKRLERKIKELSVLYSISESMESSNSVDDLIANMTELTSKILEAASCAYYFYDREADIYYYKSSFSQPPKEPYPVSLKIDRQITEQLELQRQPIIYSKDQNPDLLLRLTQAGARHDSLLLVPLFVRGENFGLLVVLNKKQDESFNESDVTFVKMLLRKASLQIENIALYEIIYANLVATLRSLVSTIEAKDPYTQRHSQRVTKISLIIAREIGCSREDLDIIQFAANLHDIGKIGISDAVLQKNGRLTNEEYQIIKGHPVIGAKILAPLGMVPQEKAIIRHHHERWDGKGYPDGLAGQDIPFLARIVSLADAYDAMTSDRVYRRKLSHEMALMEIERNADYQFDGNLVKSFLQLCVNKKEEMEVLLE